MFFEMFLQLLPILLIPTGGFFMTRNHSFDLSLLVKLIVDFFMPMLVFHPLYSSDLKGSLMVGIPSSTTLIVALLSLTTYAHAHFANIDARDFMPPGIFMNSGFIGIPLPQPVLTTLEFGGNAASPLAAFVLGGTLNTDKFTVNRHILAGVCIRLVGGFAFALLATRIFGITGVARTVLIVGSTLPSAVFTFVLPLRYGIRSEYAEPIVMLSTILGVVTIPIAFILAT